MKYNRAQFGPVLGDKRFLQGVADVGSIINEALSSPTGAERGVAENRFNNARSFGKDLVGTGKEFLFRAGARAVSPTIGGPFADLFSGSTPNPGFALLFESNFFRSFSYSWRLAPQNAGEAATLMEIIKKIKYAMHPDKKDSLFLTFPYKAQPSIKVKSEQLFSFKECVITSFTANYTPGAIPAFYNDGKPIEIDITMGLQETEIFLREDFK